MEEFYLRDYLKIIWQQKIVIIATLLLVLLISTIFAFSRSDQYRAEAQVTITDTPEAFALLSGPNGDGSMAVSFKFEVEDVYERFLAYRDPTSSLTGVHNKRKIINLSLVGSDEPEQLVVKLKDHLDSVVSVFAHEVESQIDLAKNLTQVMLQSLREKRSEVITSAQDAQLAVLASLRSQTESLTQESGSASEARRASISQILESLETESRMIEARVSAEVQSPELGFNEQLADLDARINDFELFERAQNELVSADWTPILITMEPVSLDEPVGPPWYVILFIAGLMGFFIGVLLGFFVHYVRVPTASE